MNWSGLNSLFSGRWRPTDIMNDMRRASQLLLNRNVPVALKLLLPLGAAIYWFFPLDLIPGLPFDDIAVVLLAVRLFVSLGNNALLRGAGGSADGTGTAGDGGPTVDTTWRVVDE